MILIDLERQLSFLRTAQNTGSKDIRDFMDKKKILLKGLKATREDRIKRLEDSKTSISNWIGYLLNDKELRKKVGIKMEKMRIAMENEQERLGEYHEFSDGISDIVFLNHETVKDE